MTSATLYLRLSDFRDDSDGFAGREARLRAEAARLGWDVGRVVVENDVIPAANGRARPASAFKRRKIVTPSGRTEWRVYRPQFRSILEQDIPAGRSLLCEDLDRAARDPRDLEDLVDAVAASRVSARSLSGSLTLTDGGTDSEITMARIMVAMGNKSSRDTARRVAAKRGDLAQAGAYGGGRRPFGFSPDPDAPKYAKTLLVVPAEAAEITRAAQAVMADTTLKAIARDLREREVPTVTGARWTPSTLRDILLKPAVAGLQIAGRDENGKPVYVPATWPAILDREPWEALSAKLTDPGRTTTTGNEPRHLLSGIARCHCGATVKASGSGNHRQSVGYVCAEHGHLRRLASATDALVLAYVARYIAQHAATLLRPPARPGVDTHALRAEAANLTAIGERQAAMHAIGGITDAELLSGSRTRKARLDKIAAQLSAATEPDPLAEFRGAPDARAVLAVLKALPLARRRAVVRLLVCVTLLPSVRRGPRFDEDSVRVRPA